MKIGIDASNIREGGGITHLVELLSAIRNDAQGSYQIVVWGGAATLAKLPATDVVAQRHCDELDGGPLSRIFWQRRHLSRLAASEDCDVLLVPGGNFFGDFAPTVVMCRNMLPFDPPERRRYRWTRIGLRLWLLRGSQLRSFRRSAGLIFLTEFARRSVQPLMGDSSPRVVVIPHGIHERFRLAVKPQRPISAYTQEAPLQILYVSIIDEYKHQWQVAAAVLRLREAGYPVALTLAGREYPPAMRKLSKVTGGSSPAVRWVGAVDHDQLHELYAAADVNVFASSCENMPNILLEKMASGRPVACSDRGPMPEVLGDSGVYFDPEEPESIAAALRSLLDDPEKRESLAKAARLRADQYSWDRCAAETMAFLEQVAGHFKATTRSAA